MPSTVTVTSPADTPAPPAFRVTLADAQEQYLLPEESAAAVSTAGDFGWAYGTDRAVYRVPAGAVTWVASAGPAWNVNYGQIEAAENGEVTVQVPWQRLCDPRALGLASGDVHLHTGRGRQEIDFATAFAAEDIDLAGIQYWGKYAEQDYAEDPPARGVFRLGQAWASCDEEVEMHSPWGPWEDTTVVGLEAPLPDVRPEGHYRMNARFYQEARRRGCRMIVYQAPTWAQFPVDVALGLVDSVNLCDNFFSITRPARGPWEYTHFAADDPLQNDPRGIALWVFEHYYRVLNAGFRVPVSGGSASPGGGGGGPVGMNRFYIHSDRADELETCLSAWRAGRSFATNGPLLLATVDGQGPGSTAIETAAGRNRLAVRVISNRPIRQLEWVGDGQVIAGHRLPGDMPQDATWEAEVDLRPFRWVAARCFGTSERTFLPQGGAISPPLLTAHTSPLYLAGEGPSAARAEAVSALVAHVDWMAAVIDGSAEAPWAEQGGDTVKLDSEAKADIKKILGEARVCLASKGNTDPGD